MKIVAELGCSHDGSLGYAFGMLKVMGFVKRKCNALDRY